MIIERMAEVAPVPSSDKLMLADTVIPVLRDLLDCFRGVEGRTHAEFSGRNPYGVPEFKAAQDLLIVLREMIQSYRPIRTIGASDLQHRAEEQGKMLKAGEDLRDQLDRTVPLVLRMPEIVAFEQIGMSHSFDLTGLKAGDRFLGDSYLGVIWKTGVPQ